MTFMLLQYLQETSTVAIAFFSKYMLFVTNTTLLHYPCDAPKWWIWWQYRDSDLNAIKRATLEFCGFKPVRVMRIDRLRYKNDSERHKILQNVSKFAKNF